MKNLHEQRNGESIEELRVYVDLKVMVYDECVYV